MTIVVNFGLGSPFCGGMLIRDMKNKKAATGKNGVRALYEEDPLKMILRRVVGKLVR